MDAVGTLGGDNPRHLRRTQIGFGGGNATASALFTADALAPPSTTNPRNKAADTISPAVSTDTDAPDSGRELNPRQRRTQTVLMLVPGLGQLGR